MGKIRINLICLNISINLLWLIFVVLSVIVAGFNGAEIFWIIKPHENYVQTYLLLYFFPYFSGDKFRTVKLRQSCFHT